MKSFLMSSLALLLVAGVWGQALGESQELTLDSPWTQAVDLAVGAASYNLEATDLGGAPVEVVLERYQAGVWVKAATNRQSSGAVSVGVGWSGTNDKWRVRPAKSENRTVILRLKRSVFSELRDSLKTTLTSQPEVSLPLRKRIELPDGSTGADLIAAGVPFEEPSDGKAGKISNTWGVFRFDKDPLPRVWKSTSAGWVDLELPQNRGFGKMLLGSTDDGLYVVLASQTGQRAFYRWNSEGWAALTPPKTTGPGAPEQLWAATSGAGSLFVIEGQGLNLVLNSFDGRDWSSPLDLSVLAPRGARAAVLLPPSSWSKTGTLVLTTDKVTVYDLP